MAEKDLDKKILLQLLNNSGMSALEIARIQTWGLDRDYNAALNILERAVGLGRPEPTPVEMGPLLSVPASAVVAGQVPSLKQEAPCESWG